MCARRILQHFPTPVAEPLSLGQSKASILVRGRIEAYGVDRQFSFLTANCGGVVVRTRQAGYSDVTDTHRAHAPAPAQVLRRGPATGRVSRSTS
jgi:hypothetical protein